MFLSLKLPAIQTEKTSVTTTVTVVTIIISTSVSFATNVGNDHLDIHKIEAAIFRTLFTTISIVLLTICYTNLNFILCKKSIK